MRLTTYIAFIIFIACSCQEDNLTKVDLFDEWIYEREFSSTFNYLLDLDENGTIIGSR